MSRRGRGKDRERCREQGAPGRGNFECKGAWCTLLLLENEVGEDGWVTVTSIRDGA